jgi:hypothetical protein
MSSSSLPQLRRRVASLAALLAALLGALLVMAGGVQPLELAHATGSELRIVAVVASTADRQVRLVADVRPATARPIPSGDFSVTEGSVRLPSRTEPVISARPAIGLIVDASASGAANLEAGLNGAANFLLRMPFAARTVVIADTDPPRVLAPPRTETTEALRAVALGPLRAQGARDTVNALTLALRQLPVTNGESRVVVLYTSAPDVGGETAKNLAERLTNAHAMLAVVTARAETSYWSRVTAATGGIVMAARPSAVMTAFDVVADALLARYIVTFPFAGQLPAAVSVRVNTAGESLAADAVVPRAQDAALSVGPPRGAPKTAGDDATWLLWLLVIGVAAAVVAGALFLARRVGHARSRERAESDEFSRPPWTHQELNFLLHGATDLDNAASTSTEPETPPVGESSPGRERIFDISDSEVPREIASLGEQEIDDRTGDFEEGDDTPITVGEEEPGVPASEVAAPQVAVPEIAPPQVAVPEIAPPQIARAASVAAAVAAAEQRARAVAAATRAAADAAASPLRRRSRPSGRPDDEAEG